MKQKKLAAYLGLIQDLLSCPQGEEWIHLKRYEALVDAQFVQVMEQVAAQLDRQGNPEAATFLYNWAAQLHHIFFKEIQPPSPEENSSEAYLNFIEKLLSCPEGLEEDLIVEHKSLIGPGLVHKMREVARQLRAQQEIATALSLEKFASQLNQMWIREHNFQTHLQKIPTAKAAENKAMVEKAVAEKSVVGKSETEKALSEKALSEKALSEKAEANQSVVDRDSREVPMAPDMFEPVDEIADPWGSTLTNDMTPPHDMTPPETVPMTHNLSAPETASADDCDASDCDTSVAEPMAKPQVASITDGAADAVIDAAVSSSLTPQGSESIAAGLNAISAALQQLNQTLSAEKVPQKRSSARHHAAEDLSSPLAHLEALERAHDAHWQLTTEEVEKLIGVKPRCHEKETVYQRGNWRFMKVGQLGSQIAWQVSKASY